MLLSDVPMIVLCRSAAERAEAMNIRFAVFVDEQRVPAELERDEYDADAQHLLARDRAGMALGTLRIADKGDGVAKIGRVAVLGAARGQGIGNALMQRALDLLRMDGFTFAILDAQVSVIGFYERLGFRSEGSLFEDAGILHRRMRLPLTESGKPV